MGIFTKEKKAEKIKPPSVVTTARGQIEEFIKGQPLGSVEVPTREIAGLTPFQQELQRAGKEAVRPEDFETARDVFRTEATADTDVRTSPEFEGIRRLIEEIKTGETTAIRQGAELGGVLKSTPRAGVEAENIRKLDTVLLNEFSRLEREAKDRKISAAGGLSRLGTERLGQVATASNIAEQERSIEQARNDAIYNSAIQTILFPYQEQLQLFALATGQKDDFFIKGGGLSDLGFIATTAASAASGTDFSQFGKTPKATSKG